MRRSAVRSRLAPPVFAASRLRLASHSSAQQLSRHGIASGEDCPAKPAGRRRAGMMKYVYLLESLSSPKETYVGLADDLRARVAAHNAGQSRHTSKFRPWRLV